MSKPSSNIQVDAYVSKAKKWQEETEKLRNIILDCGLTEELKWGKPCYSYEGHIVVLIQGFKKYCALLFFKGMLLDNAQGLLVKTGANTRVGRQVRFTNAPEIGEKATILKAYIKQAIEVEKAGLKVPAEKKVSLIIPEELKNKLEEVPAFKAAFATLTQGRKKGYIFYFSAAKQSKTRESRIEKCMQQILNGKGLNE